jgi:DNA-binding CsgD family transcriptional regulator/N-acetylneuraminic acid mutarotase
VAEQNEPLSEREIEILRLVATGAANKEIAHRLVISPNTVKVHLRNIFTKIGVASRTEATLYAVKTGLVQTHAVNETAGNPQTGSGADVLSVDRIAQANAPSDTFTQPPQNLFQRIKAWHWAAAAVVLLIFAASLSVSARMFAPAAVTPTVASEAVALPQGPPRWADKASLPSPRKGMGHIGYENAFYLIAGETTGGPVDDLLRYNPAADTWEKLVSKPTAVADVQAVVLGEKIYVPGGRTIDGKASNSLEVYDPRQDSWETKASLPVGLWGYALASFEGQLYLFGGRNENQYYASVYTYFPQEDRWEERAAMSTARAYASAEVIENRIHVLGGYDGTHPLDLNEAYFPMRDFINEPAWETFAPLPAPRYAMGSTHLAGMIFVLGGLSEGNIPLESSAIQYLAQADNWLEFDPPPQHPGAQSALLAAGNFLYVLGGETPGGLSVQHQSYQAIYTISVPFLQNDN